MLNKDYFISGNNSKSPSFTFPYSQIVGSILGGSLLLSIILHVYVFLKRKNKLGIASNIPLDVQYDEIGNIKITSANVHDLPDNVQEPTSTIDLSDLEGMADQLSSFEKISSSVSSSNSSVQSLSMINEDGYENPYQTVDPENIEIHPYSIVCSNLYENTIVFPKKIQIKHSNKRDPWLIIYKQTCRNTQNQ